MRKALTLQDIEAVILADVVSATGADPEDPAFVWNWSVKGIQRAHEVADILHDWIDITIRGIGEELNRFNPINKLPAEILSMIFAAASSGVYAEQLALSAVCQHWRSVSLDNPMLWSDIRIGTNTRLPPVVALGQLSRRLARTNGAPTDVALRCITLTPRYEHSDPLLKHMSHLRSLDLYLNARLLAQDFRAALTMPAPYLTTLKMFSTSIESVAYSFLPDTFSGHAPRLRCLSLTDVGLPPPKWQPLQGLTELSVRLKSAVISDLVQVLHACSSLSVLVVHADRCEYPLSWNDVPARSLPLVRVPTSVQLTLPESSLHQIRNMLSKAGYSSLPNLTAYWPGLDSACAWLSDPEYALRTTSLCLSPDSSVGGTYMMRVTALDEDNRTRATTMKVSYAQNALRALTAPFPMLRKLDIAERLWPGATFRPVLPHLEELTVTLYRPGKARRMVGDVVGIFFLPLDESATWDLPALRRIRLKYKPMPMLAPGRGNVVRNDSSPLVVSAHDIAVFLTWHVRTIDKLALSLQNVLLFESNDHDETRSLKSIVTNLDYDHESGADHCWSP